MKINIIVLNQGYPLSPQEIFSRKFRYFIIFSSDKFRNKKNFSRISMSMSYARELSSGNAKKCVSTIASLIASTPTKLLNLSVLHADF